MMTKERVFEIMGSFFGNAYFRSAIRLGESEEDLAAITELLDAVSARGYRVSNLHALTNVKDASLAPLLLSFYDRFSREHHREELVSLLGFRGCVDYVPELLALYRQEKSASVRYRISDTIYCIGSRKYIRDYLDIVSEPGYGNGPDCILGLLCKLRVQEAVTVLLHLHRKNPHDWRWTLLKYGPMTGAGELVPEITLYLESEDRELRAMAKKALEKLERNS